MEEAEPLLNSRNRARERLERLLSIRRVFLPERILNPALQPPSPASIVKENILYGTPLPSPLLSRSQSLGAIQSEPKPEPAHRSGSLTEIVKSRQENRAQNGAPAEENCSHVVDIAEERWLDPSTRRRKKLRKSNSAPAIVVGNLGNPGIDGLSGREKPQLRSASDAVKRACIGVAIYLSVGVGIYLWRADEFKGKATYSVVDALYFCIVTMCTIGYGDIVPCTTFTKMFCCGFILVGFGFIDILLSGLVSFVLDKQETVLIHSSRYELAKAYFVDMEKGRMRIRIKVGIALVVVVLCIGIGTLVVHGLEDLSWTDSFYLGVTSVTTVGFGDYAFDTMQGRLFAVVWLLISTLAVARAFLFLAELRIDKRNRVTAKWILHREMTVGDLLAADIDNNGFVSA
ncbi:two-pore potassium channel 3 isoform X3 [Cryptomeria japonica]|uniref:two-pore potassium channel 3 isoform X3 n=1 Tax=Cryptomeria japonica TaxID=3369 RepID=UPI0027DA0B3E|nr:two-pore potassium channel 3 isoform X3 [Cryptomeria japonica]